MTIELFLFLIFFALFFVAEGLHAINKTLTRIADALEDGDK